MTHLTTAPTIRGPVLIEWEDSRAHVAGWSDIDEMNDVEPCRIQSVGWLVQQDKKQIQIVPHMGNGQGCGGIVIPRKSVISIKDLRND